MARKLIVEIVGDARALERSYRQAEKATKGFGRETAGATRATATGSVAMAGLGRSAAQLAGIYLAGRGLISAVRSSVGEWMDQTQVAAQTAAALKSTSGAAGVTAKQVDQLAASISKLSGIDDEAVQQAENLLLTFTGVRNEVGKGNDVFNQAALVVANVSTAMGTDMSTAAIQVGKALNDPIRGVGQLRRIGVSFTQAQRDQIKALVESGHTLEAQRIILREFNTEFGGVAEALGKTPVGQLRRFRETVKNLGGELVGVLVPAFTGALDALNKFADRLGEAEGVRAKLNVVWEGVQDIARNVYEFVRDGVERGIQMLASVDWGLFFRRAFTTARVVGQALHDFIRDGIDQGVAFLQGVDWGAVISRVAQALSRAIVSVLNTLADLRERVDWEKLGRMIVRGIGIAIVAVVKFLVELDWASIARGIIRNLIAAIRGSAELLLGIGKELVSLIFQGLSAAVTALGRDLAKLGIGIALAVIEPFTHIPTDKLGGWARDLKDELLRQLNEGVIGGGDLVDASKKGGEQAGTAFLEGYSGVLGAVAGGGGAGAPAPEPPVPPRPPRADTTTPDKPPKGLTPTERRQRRNQWFDAMIARELDVIQDLPVKEQIARLKRVAALIQERANATTDVTRRLNLEAQRRGVLRTLRGTQAQATQDAADARQRRADAIRQKLDDADTARLGRISIQQERAAQTAYLSDDLKAARAEVTALEDIIRVRGRTPERLHALIAANAKVSALRKTIDDNQKQAAQDARARAQAREQARQFALLGLTGEGEEPTPGIPNLLKRLANIRKLTAGTPLARPELFRNIYRLLTADADKVTVETRQKIDAYFDSVNSALKEGADKTSKMPMLTGFSRFSSAAFVRTLGLDLTPAERRRLREAIAARGPGIAVPVARTTQFAGAGVAAGVTINGGVSMYGVQDVRGLADNIWKQAKQRPQPRRGQ